MNDQTKYRLNKITKIENYLIEEINQRKTCNKTLSKYVAAFDYIDKVLIVLSALTGGVCIIFSVSVVGAPVGIAGASYTLIFSLTTGIIKKLLSITRNKKKKHDKIFMLAKDKINSIEILVSQALIDMEISREEFDTILKERDKFEKMKENFKNASENMRLNNVNTKIKITSLIIIFFAFVYITYI